MKVEGGLYDLDILVDDLSVFKAGSTIFTQAEIFESIMNPIPTCTLDLMIPMDWFDKRSLSDGTSIVFDIKSKKLGLDERSYFRLFNIEELDVSQKAVHVKLDGVIDFYTGYTPANNYNMFGNSSDLFNRIASQNKLTPYIDTTNDAQLWVGGMKNLYQFMSDTAKYGWINETSAMFWCIDRHKNLLYKNLTTLFRNRQANIYTFVQRPLQSCETKEYEYGRMNSSIQNGSNNLKNGGYGGEDYYFDILTYGLKKVSARKVVAESKFINISKELSQGLTDTQSPFDVGNFHPNYYLAYKQNRRVLSTYSTYNIIDTQHLQNFRLGQIVQVEFSDSQTKANKSTALSGVGMIDAIHTTLSKEAMLCTLEVTSQGMNGIVTTREVY